MCRRLRFLGLFLGVTILANAKNEVEMRAVKVRAATNGMLTIVGGVGPEDWVVVSGVRALEPGDVVAPRRVVMPGPAAEKGRDR